MKSHAKHRSELAAARSTAIEDLGGAERKCDKLSSQLKASKDIVSKLQEEKEQLLAGKKTNLLRLGQAESTIRSLKRDLQAVVDASPVVEDDDEYGSLSRSDMVAKCKDLTEKLSDLQAKLTTSEGHVSRQSNYSTQLENDLELATKELKQVSSLNSQLEIYLQELLFHLICLDMP